MPPDAATGGVETEYGFGSGLEEIWAIKDQLSAEFDHDVEKLGRDYMEYQKRFGDRLISPPDRKKTDGPAA
ncbi:MAG TPA: hypothetical protein VEX86_26815 [Longimicrobium sp.]|nr:hypothetical protein [Longimicrobium sp.]